MQVTHRQLEVLLAIHGIEPDGYGEAVRQYLKHCGIIINRSRFYHHLDRLKEQHLVRVTMRKGERPKQFLRVTGDGKRLLRRWTRLLCRLARA